MMAVKVINLDVTPECQRQIMSELEVLYRVGLADMSETMVSFICLITHGIY